ncbi:unnamed protein product [Amoebophrya sp. A25]|nr:unnamed protein product [Amoebophrya sp. A25]|eukprot:GSA25T00003009001.1
MAATTLLLQSSDPAHLMQQPVFDHAHNDNYVEGVHAQHQLAPVVSMRQKYGRTSSGSTKPLKTEFCGALPVGLGVAGALALKDAMTGGGAEGHAVATPLSLDLPCSLERVPCGKFLTQTADWQRAFSAKCAPRLDYKRICADFQHKGRTAGNGTMMTSRSGGDGEGGGLDGEDVMDGGSGASTIGLSGVSNPSRLGAIGGGPNGGQLYPGGGASKVYSQDVKDVKGSYMFGGGVEGAERNAVSFAIATSSHDKDKDHRAVVTECRHIPASGTSRRADRNGRRSPSHDDQQEGSTEAVVGGVEDEEEEQEHEPDDHLAEVDAEVDAPGARFLELKDSHTSRAATPTQKLPLQVRKSRFVCCTPMDFFQAAFE